MYVWVWLGSGATLKFTNYKVKVEIYKVQSGSTSGSAYDVLPTPSTRKGWTFSGWSKSETSCSASNLVQAGTIITATDAHTLYGCWRRNKAIVRWTANGGTWAGSTQLGYNGTYVTNNDNIDFWSIQFDHRSQLPDVVNPNYIHIQKAGQYIATANSWKGTVGGTTKYYDQSTEMAYDSKTFCSTIETGDCTVTLTPNWKSICGLSLGTEFYYWGQYWVVTAKPSGQSYCNIARSRKASNVTGSYNNRYTTLDSSFFTSGAADYDQRFYDAKRLGHFNKISGNYVIDSNVGVSATNNYDTNPSNYIHWIASGKVFDVKDRYTYACSNTTLTYGTSTNTTYANDMASHEKTGCYTAPQGTEFDTEDYVYNADNTKATFTIPNGQRTHEPDYLSNGKDTWWSPYYSNLKFTPATSNFNSAHLQYTAGGTTALGSGQNNSNLTKYRIFACGGTFSTGGTTTGTIDWTISSSCKLKRTTNKTGGTINYSSTCAVATNTGFYAGRWTDNKSGTTVTGNSYTENRCNQYYKWTTSNLTLDLHYRPILRIPN